MKLKEKKANNYNVNITFNELYDIREFCRFYKSIQPTLSQYTNMETKEFLKSSKKMIKDIERIINNEN